MRKWHPSGYTRSDALRANGPNTDVPPSFYWAPRARQSPSPVPLHPQVLKVHLWPPLPQPLPWLRSHHLISAVAFHPASLPPGSLHPQPSFAQGDSAVVNQGLTAGCFVCPSQLEQEGLGMSPACRRYWYTLQLRQ